MGRSPCCSKVGLRRGPWSAMEDSLLTNFIQDHGEGQWRSLPKRAGLLRCGKSCRLRWMNYLRPGIKRGNITQDEEDLILRLHALLGNRWSLIAGRLPGRTDNEIKNYWNTHLLKKLNGAGINPDLPKPQLPKLKQKPKPKQNKIRDVAHKNNAALTAAEVEKENDPPPHNKTRLYLPKPIRVTSDFSRTSSYDSLASGASCGSEKPVLDDIPMDWPPLLEIEDATYGVDIISDGGEHHFLASGEFALPLLTHSDSISDDVEMLEKVYDEYLQLLEF